jgi:hypothetical protein
MGGDNNTDGEGVYLDDIEIATLSQSHWPDWLVPARTNGTLTFPAADALPLQLLVGTNTPRRLLQRLPRPSPHLNRPALTNVKQQQLAPTRIVRPQLCSGRTPLTPL